MNHTVDAPADLPLTDGPHTDSGSSLDDPRVVRAVQEYLALIEAGKKPNRSGFVNRYPDIAAALGECLAGLEFVQAVAPDLSRPVADHAPPSTGELPQGGMLGDFRLLREVGRGGMGIVYEAEQVSLHRRVALKVLPFAAALDMRHLQRFKNEAQAAACLHHTNIVPVFFVGCERGVHFYAMQFIDGHTLGDYIAELRQSSWKATADVVGLTTPYAPADRDHEQAGNHPATPPSTGKSSQPTIRQTTFFRTAARLGAQAAGALEYAHQMGIVHRDIKPGNLLLDNRGELWVTDFGLAQVQSDTRLTLTGDLVGTLRYMSPEQARGGRPVIDHRTDIYSLGVTLYELLTLEPAFDGQDRQQLLRQIVNEEPRPPRRINSAIPFELETIVLKAMAKAPGERYSTAGELADDLGRWLRDEPIRGRRPTVFQRLTKFARRHRPVVVTAMLSFVLLLVLSVIGLAIGIRRVQAEQQEKEQEANQKIDALNGEKEALQRERDALAREKKALENWKRTAYYLRTALAFNEWKAANVMRADQLLDECPEELRNWEWHYLKRLCHSERSSVSLAGKGGYQKARFSSDARRVALTFPNRSTVAIHDAATGKNLVEITSKNHWFDDVAFSPDCKYLATMGGDRPGFATVRVFEISSRKEIAQLKSKKGIEDGQAFVSVVFSPDGRQIAATGRRGNLSVWDVANGKERFQIPAHPIPNAGSGLTWNTRVAFSPEGDRLISASEDDGVVKIWDAQTGAEVQSLGRGSGFRQARFSPRGTWVAAIGTDMTVRIWEVKSGQTRHILRGHTKFIHELVFSSDEKRLATASSDGTIRLWNVQTGNEAGQYPSGQAQRRFAALAFSADGKTLIALEDRTIKTWDGTHGPEALALTEGRGAWNAALSPEGQYVTAASMDLKTRVWDARTGQELHKFLIDDSEAPQTVAFGPGGKEVAIAFQRSEKIGNVGGVRVWSLQTGKLVRTLPDTKTEFLPPAVAVAWSGDGNYLACGFQDRVVRVWEAATGKLVFTLGDHTRTVSGVAFSTDNRRLVSASGGVDIRTHFPGPNPFKLKMDGPKDIPDLKVWDLKTGKSILTLSLPNKTRALGISPDGETVAAAFGDKSVRLYEVATGKEVLVLKGHSQSPLGVAFSPDGRRLVTGGGSDEAVKLWDTTTGEEIMTVGRGPQMLTGVSFSPDGQQIVATTFDDVKIWDATPLKK